MRHAINWTPAGFVVSGVRGFAESTTSFVPRGFPAYARVFHPARLEGDGGHEATWRDIADAGGKIAHPGMQFEAIADTSLWRRRVGTLPVALLEKLTAILGRHTTKPDSCYFAVWDGWGALTEHIAQAPMFTIPGRGYHLLVGPIAAAFEDVRGSDFGEIQTASIWWPEDRAWCVATEIDLDCTFIACSRACLAELLAAQGIEALEIRADMPWAPDTLN